MAKIPGFKPAPDEPSPPLSVAVQASDPTPRKRAFPSREGKKSINIWLEKPLLIQLQIEAAKQETTIQAIGHEAILDWCRKHGVKLPEV